MGTDQAALDGAFSPLSINDSTLYNGFDFMSSGSSSPTTAAPASSTSQANPTSQVSGFQGVMQALTSVFTSGIQAYNGLAVSTGLPLANGQPTVAPVVSNPVVFLGMTQQQLYLVGGGVAVIVLLFAFKRR
jgi:hypothetical protein